MSVFFFFQAEDGIRDTSVTGVQTCALPISELEPFRHTVLAVADDRQRVPISPRCRRTDAYDRVDHGVGRRRGGRRTSCLDHGRAALLDDLDELPLEPAVVADDFLDRQTGDAGVVSVRV